MPAPSTLVLAPPPRRGAVVLVVAGTLAVLGWAIAAAARDAATARGEPARDEAIIAEVPARGRNPGARALDQLGQVVARAPRDVGAATQLAQLALQLARRSGDPRFLGRAQAALAPWWQEAAPPAPVLLLRATIKQSRHDFEAALIDLDRLLQMQPDDAQARLVQAVVLTVRGRYAEALASCRHLPARGTGGDLVAQGCAAPAEAALGRVGPALSALERALATGVSPADVAWGHSLAGEIGFWSGQLARAEAHLRRALALDPGDNYSRTLLADLLLDADRADEVVALLAGREADDTALLRLALAERRRGSGRAPGLIAELGERFAGARRRADFSHGREEARFALFLVDDPARALARALDSWDTQHEPWDARLVMAASHSTPAVNPAVLPAIAAVAAFVAERGSAWQQVRPLLTPGRQLARQELR